MVITSQFSLLVLLANFANSSNPWFKRGGNWNNGTESGAFAFNNNSGTTNTNNSFRVVLAPRLQYNIYLIIIIQG